MSFTVKILQQEELLMRKREHMYLMTSKCHGTGTITTAKLVLLWKMDRACCRDLLLRKFNLLWLTRIPNPTRSKCSYHVYHIARHRKKTKRKYICKWSWVLLIIARSETSSHRYRIPFFLLIIMGLVLCFFCLVGV